MGLKKTMSILFVLENHYPNIGGVETLFKKLTEALVKNGHEVNVVTTLLDKSHPREETINGVKIYRYPFYSRYLFTFIAVFPVLRHIKNCDIVHTTSYNAGLPAFLASKLRGKKVIITFHEVWGKMWFKLPYMGKISLSLHYLFEQMLVKLPFNRFVAVSESTAESLSDHGVKPKRINVNYNGLDYDKIAEYKEEKHSQPNKFTYTFCGRLGVSKGLDLILPAAEKFKAVHPDSQLKMIIPTTPEGLYNTILKEIEDRNLSNYVVLKHELDEHELAREMLSSSCIIVPSYSEGFCFVAVEAMALDIPIISSDKKALREVVNGKHLKMKSHTSDALYEALLLAKEEKWDSTPRKKFELKDSVQRYIDLYNEMIG